MKPFTFILVVILATAGGFIGNRLATGPQPAVAVQKNTPAISTAERVKNARTIRCGYYLWNPFMMKDANTGAFSGLFYDMFNTIADNLGLKVEWAEEIGLGEFPAALASGRIDAYCTPLAQVGSRAGAVDFTDAVGYLPVYAFVKADNTKFNGDLTRLDAQDVTISTMDGEMSAILAASLFPKAKAVQLPQNSPSSDLLNNVVTGKADVVLNEYMTVNKFLETNPNTLKQIPNSPPVGVFGGGFTIDQGQDVFRQMLNWSIRELLLTGRIEAIYKKHSINRDIIILPAKPY